MKITTFSCLERRRRKSKKRNEFDTRKETRRFLVTAQTLTALSFFLFVLLLLLKGSVLKESKCEFLEGIRTEEGVEENPIRSSGKGRKEKDTEVRSLVSLLPFLDLLSSYIFLLFCFLLSSNFLILQLFLFRHSLEKMWDVMCGAISQMHCWLSHDERQTQKQRQRWRLLDSRRGAKKNVRDGRRRRIKRSVVASKVTFSGWKGEMFLRRGRKVSE